MQPDVEQLLNKVSDRLGSVRGIDAVVLCGSRAVGTAQEDSDIDIGIYYDDGAFDFEGFRRRAAGLDDARRQDCVVRPGEWGKWVNGGGWLKVDTLPVDLLLRSSNTVAGVMDDCMRGDLIIDYQRGYPFGFVNSIYMGEVFHCIILHEGNGFLRMLKGRLEQFSESYRRAAINKFLWEFEFSLTCGRKAVDKKDVTYAAGSLYRCAVSLVQVLYAFNHMYWLNEKDCIGRLVRQRNAVIPERFVKEIEAVFSNLNSSCIGECFDQVERQYQLILKLTE